MCLQGQPFTNPGKKRKEKLQHSSLTVELTVSSAFSVHSREATVHDMGVTWSSKYKNWDLPPLLNDYFKFHTCAQCR